MDVSAPLQNLLYLVSGNRVHAATKRVQLHQFQVSFITHPGGSLIKPRMISPLVTHPQGTFQAAVNHRILGENRHSQADNQLRNSVVNLRIQVIGTPGEHNPAHPVFTNPR